MKVLAIAAICNLKNMDMQFISASNTTIKLTFFSYKIKALQQAYLSSYFKLEFDVFMP